MIPFYESTIVSPKRKSKKQREIVWFNESFTCPEFEREGTKYQRIILLFSTTVATLTLSWLSRLSTNFFRSTHKKGEGRMARVPRIQSIQGQDSCRDSWGCSPSVYSPIITGGGGTIVKTLPWWRKLALLLAEDETRLPLSSFPNPPPNFDGRTPTFRPARAFYRGYRCN